VVTSDHYAHKSPDYFIHTQQELLLLITGNGHRVLDMGCGEGNTGALLKSTGKAREVHGVELVPEIAARAHTRLDSVIVGDLETISLPFEPGYFDYIIATEVLEHLIDPGGLLSRLKGLLRPNGYFIASTPNMRHIRLLWHLAVQGDWHYTDSGPLDRTHLRFFTRRSLVRLFVEAGYEVESTHPVLLQKARILSRLTFHRLDEFLAYRYYCKASVSAAT